MTDIMTFGDRIRNLREAHECSLRQLARKLKISAPFLSDVELGRRHPSEEVLQRIADALGTTAEDLRKYDARPPVQALKRMAANNPAMGFALQKIVADKVNPEKLLEFLNQGHQDRHR